MTVKILHKIFLLLLLATFMLTSCHDDDEPIDEPTDVVNEHDAVL